MSLKALKEAKKYYREEIKTVKEEHHLLPLSKNYYKPYKNYAEQAQNEDDSKDVKNSNLSDFGDIYENSFEQENTMTKSTIKKCVAIISIFILAATVLVGCGGTTESSKKIITSENIQKISVELFDKSKKTFEGDSISQVTEMVNKATLTREKSVQDAPDTHPLGRIIINDGEEVIYYYQKNDKYYFEKPYSGIYETSIDVNDFLSEL